MRVLITGARAPAALHLARSFHRAQHSVVLADCLRFPLARATRLKAAYTSLPAPADGLEPYGRAVDAAVQDFGCDLVIPTCEEVFHLAAWRDLRHGSIPLLAPDFALLEAAHNKFAFATLARGCGADAPPTQRLTCRADVEAAAARADTLIFKPVWSRFGARVLVRPDKTALAVLRPTPSDPWVAQEYLPGTEICSWAVLHEGRVLALSCYEPLYRVNDGASVAFMPVAVPEIDAFVAAFGAKTKWTGQAAFDFRRSATGTLHVLECNPRATSGVNLFGPEAGLAAAFLGEASAAPDQNGPMTLPLAFLAYGLPEALRKHGLSGIHRWRRDARLMADLTAWPGDRTTLPMQLLSLAELAIRAARARLSLSAASTADIEWNGTPFDAGTPAF